MITIINSSYFAEKYCNLTTHLSQQSQGMWLLGLEVEISCPVGNFDEAIPPVERQRCAHGNPWIFVSIFFFFLVKKVPHGTSIFWAGWFISSENQMETSNWVQSPKKSQNLRNLRSFRCYFRTDASPQGFHVAPWCWYIYLQNWVSFWANVGKYSIHGASGFVVQDWHTQASASSLAQKTSTSILRNWKQHRMVAKSWTSW